MVKPFPRYWALLPEARAERRRKVDSNMAAGKFHRRRNSATCRCGSTSPGSATPPRGCIPEIAELKRKGGDSPRTDKQDVFDRQHDVLKTVLSYYRDAGPTRPDRDQHDAVFSSDLPLVYNTEFARRCMPGRELPPQFAHPEDVRAQSDHGARFARASLRRTAARRVAIRRFRLPGTDPDFSGTRF